MKRLRRDIQGYILIEATVAMVVLSVGAMMVHGTMRQSIMTLGQSDDFTQARFLLGSLMSEIELQPELLEGKKTGVFARNDGRFNYEYTIRKIEIPLPKAPAKVKDPRTNENKKIEFNPQDMYLLHVRSVVKWSRGGRQFEESLETLLDGRLLYVPPEDQDRR